MPATMDRQAAAAERQRAANNANQRRQRQALQEIGDIPPVADAKRRQAAEDSFAFFCRTYFPDEFLLPWSEYHHAAADRIERAVGAGGLFAFAMPRGSGKSTICAWAVLWSVLTGKCRYVVLVGATAKSAQKQLSTIRVHLQTNDLIAADWPEVCGPIHALERSPARARQQTHNGEPTAMQWLKDTIVLPTVTLQPGEGWVKAKGKPALAPTSGSIIEVTGLTGEIRGLKHTREDGTTVRPDFVICDDPQTRDSAKSPSQCADREAVISGDIVYLAGPTTPTAVVMPCTVVYQNDMADRMLDRSLHPEWQGERTKMVEKFPPGLIDQEKTSESTRLWQQYGDIRRNEFENGGDGSVSTAFYADHRAAMDEGWEVTWPERHKPDEISAIQHAVNCWLRDPAAFFSEYQNDPVSRIDEGEQLDAEAIGAKQTQYARGVVPAKCQTVTAFVDVGKDLLWWVVAAWEDHFTGHVIDYGAYPEQGTEYVTGARVTMQHESPGAGLEGAIYAGLDKLTRQLCSKWQREDGVQLELSRLLIDANWAQSTPVVYRLCSASPHAAQLLPAHGQFVGATSKGWSELKGQKNEKIGHHWRLGPTPANRAIRRVLTDVNYWKSFVHDRFATPMGDRGCLTLFNGRHRMFADHLTAEYRVRVTAGDREVDEWKAKPDEPDNHLFDCMVGAAVAASIEGVTLAGTQSVGQQPRKVRRYKDLNALRRRNR